MVGAISTNLRVNWTANLNTNGNSSVATAALLLGPTAVISPASTAARNLPRVVVTLSLAALLTGSMSMSSSASTLPQCKVAGERTLQISRCRVQNRKRLAASELAKVVDCGPRGNCTKVQSRLALRNSRSMETMNVGRRGLVGTTVVTVAFIGAAVVTVVVAVVVFGVDVAVVRTQWANEPSTNLAIAWDSRSTPAWHPLLCLINPSMLQLNCPEAAPRL